MRVANLSAAEQRAHWVAYLRQRGAYCLDVGADNPAWRCAGSVVLRGYCAARASTIPHRRALAAVMKQK